MSAFPAAYWRDARWLSAALALVLMAAFSPFLFGPFSLLSSASDAPSLYLAGSAPQLLNNHPINKELDPGAGSWQSEAWLPIEHEALVDEHRLPLWDPYDGYGAPFAAAAQPQPWFPLTLLASLHPAPRVWNWYVVARLYVAGLFAALFVLFYGGRFGSLAAGLAASLSGYYLLFYQMPHVSVETLLPAALWGTEWLLRRPGPAPIAALGVTVGAIYLGGMPESAAVVLLATGFYFGLRNVGREPLPWPFARVTAFVAANVLGIAIGAAMLLPFAEYLPYAIDTHRGGPPIGLAFDGYPFRRVLFQKLVPLAYGPPLNTVTDPLGNGFAGLRGWFGASTAAFALIALFDAVRRRSATWSAASPALALWIVFVCALGKAVGAPWINWIGGLPVLRLIVFAKYDEVTIDVTIALLCGLGISVIERATAIQRWAVPVALACVGVAGFFGYVQALSAVPPTEHAIFLYASTIFAVLVLIALLVVTRIAPGGARGAAAIAALVGIETIGNYYAPMYGHVATIPPITRNPYAGAPFVVAIRSADNSRLRVMGIGGPLWPNWSGAMRLDNPEALNGMYPTRYMRFLNAFLKPTGPESRDLFDRFDSEGNESVTTDLARRWLSLSSIGFVVVRPDRTVSDAHLRLIYDRDVKIYAYEAPLPRAAIFHRVATVADNDVLRLLTDPKFDVTKTLIVTGAANRPPPRPAVPSRSESARIVQRDVSGVAIDATLRAPGYVMLNDTFFPGWTATVDGVAEPIVEADYLFRAVAVDAGPHRIVFAYRPLSATMGLTLTLLGLLAAIGCALMAQRRARFAGNAPVHAARSADRGTS